ncbi:MAG: type II toxin-antitoxin system HicA family toxin [Pseudomonadales bacterium]|nr:type II toxin-antitoxin system HicA family toxin [Pseudomonadales bacterium]
MSGAFPPLDCKDVKRILKALGFAARPMKGTSHEQWVKYDKDGRLLGKVTVDCPKQPFGPDLVSSMARQAGVSKREFYAKLK